MADFRPVYSAAGAFPVALETTPLINVHGDPYEHHRLIAGTNKGVVILAVSESHMVFVESYRVAADALLLELPRGGVDVADGDGPGGIEAAARRELREEAAIEGGVARILGSYIVDSTIYPAVASAVQINDCYNTDAARDGEVERVVWVAVSEISNLIADSTLRDAHTLSALALWTATRGKESS